MLKSNKGITGIALTITIAVLAILAVVTISAVMNTGLIDVTKKAKEDYEQAAIEEVNRESELKNLKNAKYAESVSNSTSLNINDSESLVLKNYRIYGNSQQDIETYGTPAPDNEVPIQSVGDYDSTTKKYKIPVSVTGKNLMPESTYVKTYGPYNGITTKYEGNGIFHIYGEYTNNTSGGVSGHAYQTNLNIPFEDPTAKYTLSATLLSGTFSGSYLVPYIGTYSDTVSHTNWLAAQMNQGVTAGQTISRTLAGNYYMSDAKGMTRFWIYWSLGSGKTFSVDCRIQVWLEKSSTATPYEPYKGFTTNIYLDEPLRSVGSYADYIDFKEQKVVRQIYRYDYTGNENWVEYSNKTTALTELPKKGLRCIYKERSNRFIDSGSSSVLGMALANANSYRLGIDQYKNIPNVTDISTLKTWLQNNNTYFIYRLDTPIETQIDLPDIPINEGYTSIMVNTSVKPSKIEINY